MPPRLANSNHLLTRLSPSIACPKPPAQRQKITSSALTSLTREPQVSIVNTEQDLHRSPGSEIDQAERPSKLDLQEPVPPRTAIITPSKASHNKNFVKTFRHDIPTPILALPDGQQSVSRTLTTSDAEVNAPWPSPRFEQSNSSQAKADVGYFSKGPRVSSSPYQPTEKNVFSVAIEITAANNTISPQTHEKLPMSRQSTFESPKVGGIVARRRRKSRHATEQETLPQKQETTKIFDFGGNFGESDESDISTDGEIIDESIVDEDEWVGRGAKFWDELVKERRGVRQA
ncbi:uncharacterized protein KY384_005392 [Bacidia gigantensis]|uniref:uncharacterized protein n=1 Tax=Bacidia gigantensis TaxID=2732470 RepID=UPI001D041FED|nr:uncharacterized protein KY384_005392 [Bacidia gigantensis]KAG8529911.1 hypothetical protein KY384_005392 [Bacidia gigantensis]